MTEAAVKRARLEAVADDESTRAEFPASKLVDDTQAHHEACMFFSAEKMARKAARISRNQDHKPRVETIVMKEDVELTHMSGCRATSSRTASTASCFRCA
jgi:hypothetical protein